jgi:flagellin-like protein
MGKGISPFIASVLLIAFTVAVGAIVSLWINALMRSQASEVGSEADLAVKCRKAGIRILDDTIKCNFTGTDYLNFSLENTGYIDVYNFRAYLYINGVTYSYDVLDVSANQNFTKDGPLKIGEIKTVLVNITDSFSPTTISWLKISTQCPDVSDRVENITC